MTLKILADGRTLPGRLRGTPETMRLDPSVSPLVLCDRMLTLAKDVDRAGLREVAEHLVELAARCCNGRVAAEFQNPVLTDHRRAEVAVRLAGH